MTASLPAEARECFSSFITTEYTTIDARQQPITWPVTPYYTDGGPTIDVTTGLGYPKKADDARRNPRVSLLFSDPTGSGAGSAARVLVQGIAHVDEEDLEANRERYMRESSTKLPATQEDAPAKVHARAARRGTTRASTSACARSASSSGPTATSRPSPRSTTRTSRRSDPATPRSRRSRTPRRAAAESPGTPASSSSAAATRWRCSPGSGRTAFRSRSACRSPSTMMPA